MARLSNLRIVDPVLSNLALGYSNADMVGEVLMPMVELDKEAGKIPKFGKEAFKLYSTLRALRAKSNRINPENIGAIDVAMDEHDLEYPIDYREDAESAFPLQAHATYVTTEGIQLRREKMIADMVQDASNYATGNKVALSGTSQFSNATSDVLGVVDDAKEAIRKKIGREPNRAVIDTATFRALRRHPQLLELHKYTKTGMLTHDELADILELDQLAVAKAIYSDDNGTFNDFWNKCFAMAYVPKKQANMARSVYEPSFGYTVRRKGSTLVDTRTEDGKLEIVRATDIFRPYMLGADAGYLISNTVA